jgi:hypothetical protein
LGCHCPLWGWQPMELILSSPWDSHKAGSFCGCTALHRPMWQHAETFPNGAYTASCLLCKRRRTGAWQSMAQQVSRFSSLFVRQQPRGALLLVLLASVACLGPRPGG